MSGSTSFLYANTARYQWPLGLGVRIIEGCKIGR